MSARPNPVTYLLTFVGLLGLTTGTLLFSFVPLGPFQSPVALMIAAAKGLLIALFFMHLVEQRAVNALALLVTLVLLACFVALVAADELTRDRGAFAAEPIRGVAASAPDPTRGGRGWRGEMAPSQRGLPRELEGVGAPAGSPDDARAVQP